METKPFKERITKKAARDKFNKEYPNISKYNTAQKFNGKVEKYCEFYKLEISTSKYNGSPTYHIAEDGAEEIEDMNAPPF